MRQVQLGRPATVHWLTALAGFEAELESARAADERAARERQASQEQLTQSEVDLGALQQEVDAKARRVRELEGELMELEAQLTRKREQQDLIRDNKEFQALSHEIEALTADKDARETEALDLIEQLDGQRNQIARLSAELADQREDLAELQAGAEQRDRTSRERNEEIQREIETCTAQLPVEMAAAIRRLRSSVKPPVVWLDGEACGGCHAQFPTQIALSISRGDIAERCQTCGRYVVGPP